MPFKKGESGNPQGRKLGSQNKATGSVRNAVQKFVDNNILQLQEEYDQLTPVDKLNFLEKLLKFVLPTLKSVELSNEGAPMHIPHFDEIRIVHTSKDDLPEMRKQIADRFS